MAPMVVIACTLFAVRLKKIVHQNQQDARNCAQRHSSTFLAPRLLICWTYFAVRRFAHEERPQHLELTRPLVSPHRLPVSRCSGTQLNSRDSCSGFHELLCALRPAPFAQDTEVSNVCYTQENRQRFDLH